jgi:hypothetical protein
VSIRYEVGIDCTVLGSVGGCCISANNVTVLL